MKNVCLVGSAHGCTEKIGIGFTKKIFSVCLGAALLAGIVSPREARADSPTMNQLQYLQYLVQLSGDTDKFSPSSTASTYVDWARSQGMNPAGGWQPDATLSRDVLAQTLVQFYNLKEKKGTDAAVTLLREGIQLPSETSITRSGFLSLIDEFGVQSRSEAKHKTKKTKAKSPTKKPTKKPTVPKVKTPKRPTPGKNP